MSSVHRIKLLILGLLLFPIALFAQTSQDGRIMEGTFATRPTVCTPGDYYVTTDTNPVVEYKCSTGNVWNPEAAGGGGTPPGAPPNSPQCNNNAGTAFRACTLNTEIIYVSATGNDGNNGLSWDTAKATVFAALEALPNGTTSPPQVGQGTIYVGDNVWWNPDHTKGLWILDVNDPNYASPPAGWIRGNPSTFWPINIIGQGCGTLPAGNTNIAACVVKMSDFAGVGNGGTNNPAIWLAGAQPTHLENINVSGNYARCMALGIDSTGNRSNTATAAVNKSFQNMSCAGADGVDTTGRGRGPSIDIGPAFFDTFDKVFATKQSATNQSLIAAAPTGLSVTGGVLTVTFTAANTAFFTGEGCGILGANNPAYNFSVQGTPGGSGITVVSGTQITMPTTLPNGTSGGGFFTCDRDIPVILDAGTTAAGGEIIYRDATLNGGGIKQRGGQLTVRDVTIEGDFTHCIAPVIWFIASGGGLGQGVIGDYIGESDQCTSVNPADIANPVKVEGAISAENIQITSPIQSPYTEGPMTFRGDNNYSAKLSPINRAEFGVVRNHLQAQTDVHRHSPQSARYVNFANQTAAGWTTTGLTITAGQTDNDGGTNAVKAVVPSGTASILFMNGSSAPGAWNVGDIGICGLWMQNLGAPDIYIGNAALNIACNNAGHSASLGCNFPVVNGDGEWDWYFCSFVATDSIGAFTNFATGNLTTSTPINVYAPTIIHIPAGQISSNEATQLAYDMRTYLPTCAVGQSCDHIGDVVHTASGVNTALTGQHLITTNGSLTATPLSPGIQDGNGGTAVVTTPYTIQCDSATALVDRAHLLRFQSGASAVTVPLSSAAGCGAGFVVTVVDDSAGTLTFSRTAPDTFSVYNGGSTTTGATSFLMSNGQHATLTQGATGIWEVRLVGAGVGGGASPLTATFYFSPNCPAANTGGCINTPADTQEADTCAWASSAPDVNCYSQLNYITGSVTSNVATYSPIGTSTVLQTVPSTWAIGNSVTITGFSAADTFFNQTCTLTATTTTSFSCALTHANATATTAGSSYNTNVGPFVLADVGKSVMGARTCEAFMSQAIMGANPIAVSTVPTIATFVNSTHVLLSVNPANTQAVVPGFPGAGGCFIWGHPDDVGAATLEAAYAVASQCPKIEMAAGYYLFSQIHFTTQPASCVHNPVGLTDTAPGGPSTFFGNVFYSGGIEFEGRGATATIWYLLPNFPNGTVWQNGPNAIAAFMIPVEGRWHNFQISGGYQSNPANFPSSGELIYMSVGSLDNFICTNFGAYSTAPSIGFRLDWQSQLYQVVNSGCGNIGGATVSTHGQVTCFKCSFENSSLNDFIVGTSSGGGWDFACYDCRFFNSQATAFPGGSPIDIRNNGRLFLEHSVVNTGTNTTGTQMIGIANVTAGAIANIKDSYINFTTSATNNIAIQQTAAGQVFTQNSAIGGGSAGQDYADVAGSTLYLQGGTAWSFGRFSIAGQVIGEGLDFKQNIVTAGKLVLSAGWGSTAAVTALSGGNQPIQFTITNSGTGQGASPTITYTFPVTYAISPFSCTATQVGGTNATGTFTSSALSATGVTFTFSLTPTASSTEIVQVACVTP